MEILVKMLGKEMASLEGKPDSEFSFWFNPDESGDDFVLEQLKAILKNRRRG